MKPSLTKKTSRRSIGGPSMGAASTPFQELSINEPALRPQAAPVSSFVQARSPNAPGPVVLSDPQLTPEPASISNLEKLANELGSLNTNLQQFATAGIQRAKDVDEDRRATAETIGRLSNQQYPGQTYLEWKDKVEADLKKADPASDKAKKLQALFDRLQALNPVTEKYAEQYRLAAQLETNILNFENNFHKARQITGADGEPVNRETLSPESVEFKNHLFGMVDLPTDKIIQKEYEEKVRAVYKWGFQQQSKDHGEYKKQKYISSINDKINVSLQNKKTTSVQLAAEISNADAGVRKNLGVEAHQGYKESIPDNLTNSVIALSTVTETDGAGNVIGQKLDSQLFKYYSNKAMEAFPLIVIGPNGEKLVDSLEPDAALSLAQQMMSTFSEINKNHENISKDLGEEIAEKYVVEFKLGDADTYSSTAKTTEAINKASAAVSADGQLTGDLIATQKAKSYINSIVEVNRKLFSKPVQDLFIEKGNRIVNNPDLDATTKRIGIDNLRAQGLTAKNAGPLITRIDKQDEVRDDGYGKIIRERINKAKGGLKDQFRKAIAARDNILETQFTSKQEEEYEQFFTDLNTARMRNKEAIFSQPNPGNMSDELWLQEKMGQYKRSDTDLVNAAADNIQKIRDELPIIKASQIENLEEAMKETSTQGQKNSWTTSIGRTKIISTETFKNELNTLLYQNQLSPSMIEFLNRIGWRRKKDNRPGDFFIKQYSFHFSTPMPDKVKKQLVEVVNKIAGRRGLKAFDMNPAGNPVSDL